MFDPRTSEPKKSPNYPTRLHKMSSPSHVIPHPTSQLDQNFGRFPAFSPRSDQHKKLFPHESHERQINHKSKLENLRRLQPIHQKQSEKLRNYEKYKPHSQMDSSGHHKKHNYPRNQKQSNYASMSHQNRINSSNTKKKSTNNRKNSELTPELITSNFYMADSTNKPPSKYSTLKAKNGISFPRFGKSRNKDKSYNASFPNLGKQGSQPIQIIQQININQIKNQVVNKISIGSKYRQPKRAKSKYGTKKQVSAPNKKQVGTRRNHKKTNTYDHYKSRQAKRNTSRNLQSNLSRLKNLHRKMEKGGIISKTDKTKSIHSKGKSHRLRHLKKAKDNLNKSKIKKPRNLYNHRNRKAVTTSMNKRTYHHGKKRSQFKKAGNQDKKPYSKGLKRNPSKAKNFDSISKNKRQLYKYQKNKKQSKTPQKSKYSTFSRKKPLYGKASKTTSPKVRKNFNSFQSKLGRKKETKNITFGMGRNSQKRYVFKSQRDKEKKLKREIKLKQEKKKQKELQKKKRMGQEILQMGYNLLEKKAETSLHSKQLLSLVQRNNEPTNRKNKVEFQMVTWRTPIGKRIQSNQPKPQCKADFLDQNQGFSHPPDYFEIPGEYGQAPNHQKEFEEDSTDLKDKVNRPTFHRQTKMEVNMALEEVEDQLKNIRDIRKSKLRAKLTRSLNKKLPRFNLNEEIGNEQESSLQQMGKDPATKPDLEIHQARAQSELNQGSQVKIGSNNDNANIINQELPESSNHLDCKSQNKVYSGTSPDIDQPETLKILLQPNSYSIEKNKKVASPEPIQASIGKTDYANHNSSPESQQKQNMIKTLESLAKTDQNNEMNTEQKPKIMTPTNLDSEDDQPSDNLQPELHDLTVQNKTEIRVAQPQEPEETQKDIIDNEPQDINPHQLQVVLNSIGKIKEFVKKKSVMKQDTTKQITEPSQQHMSPGKQTQSPDAQSNQGT